jgi:hypothetical protein
MAACSETGIWSSTKRARRPVGAVVVDRRAGGLAMTAVVLVAAVEDLTTARLDPSPLAQRSAHRWSPPTRIPLSVPHI